MKKLFSEHIKVLQNSLSAILEEKKLDGLIIYSGSSNFYFADDQEVPFRPNPHFNHWCPERSPQRLLVLRPEQRPHLIRYAPQDFWYEQQSVDGAFWFDEFQITEVQDKKDLWKHVGQVEHHCFSGTASGEVREKGLSINPKEILSILDWNRGIKTQYEIQNIVEANKIAAQGHKAAREAFVGGGSELNIHHQYLSEVACMEHELPYPTIVGIDRKSAVLHYQFKRQNTDGGVMLIDAGVHCNGYASDITRTYAKKQVHKVFQHIIEGMEQLQQDLCSLVKSGVSYLTLHGKCHEGIAALLLDLELLSGLSVDQAIDKGLTRLFFPHGLGHMLGLQVHDVSGLQKNAQGDPCDRDTRYKTLRAARDLRENEVITIEPGFYFIPVLLDPERAGSHSKNFNWPLIDALIPWGGVRIEDNIQVKEGHSRNITREFLGNDFVL